MAHANSSGVSFAQVSHDHTRGKHDMVESETIAKLGADSPAGHQTAQVAIACGYRVQALTHDRLARFLIYQKGCQNYLSDGIFIANGASRSTCS